MSDVRGTVSDGLEEILSGSRKIAHGVRRLASDNWDLVAIVLLSYAAAYFAADGYIRATDAAYARAWWGAFVAWGVLMLFAGPFQSIWDSSEAERSRGRQALAWVTAMTFLPVVFKVQAAYFGGRLLSQWLYDARFWPSMGILAVGVLGYVIEQLQSKYAGKSPASA
jgi:hypothetical protein